MTKKTVRIATRGSKLALWQANRVADLLNKKHPDLVIEQVVITTSGDRIQDKSLRTIGGKGLFVKEIQQALLSKEADIAVHSLKDYPGQNPEGLVLACIPEREDFRDCLLTLNYRNTLVKMKAGARIGTGSLRRQVQILAMRPDLDVVEIRGNVDTRIRKLEAGDYDGIVLAKAGLNRLGIKEHISQIFDPSEMIPAPGQGAIGIECRQGDEPAISLVKTLEDPEAAQVVAWEREFMALVGGSCQLPAGCFARPVGSTLFLRACLAEEDGTNLRSVFLTGTTDSGSDLVQQAVKQLQAS